MCEVRLDNVAMPAAALIGDKHGGWPALSRVLDRATVALCAEMCGGAQQVLDMTTAYAKIRIAFGKPIGSYQGVKHKAADMLVDIENAKSLTYYAAWAIDEGLAEAPLAVSMAKAYASDAYRKVAGAGIQLHGGIGYHLGARPAALLQARQGLRGRLWRRHLAPRARRPAARSRMAGRRPEMQAENSRQNNFDALRLIAAASVVFSHSFLIAEGTQDHEWLIWLTGNQSILGLVGVFVFFAISGFLVTQSFEETGDPLRFLAKRALRIFPGLFVATVAVGVRAGAARHDAPAGAFLSRPEPYEYVVGNTLLDQTVHELPGVMFVNNPVGLEINGSLWTLRLEFTMYLMVLVLGVLRLLTVRSALLLLAFGMACLHFNMLYPLEKWGWFFQLLSGWGWLVGFFAAGMVLYKLRHTRIFDGRIALLALAGLVLSVPLRQFILLFPVFGCYLALWLALTPRLPVIPAARFGDLSYGIYIYGWPVEQGGDLAPRRPGRVVAGVPDRIAGGGGARLPVLASGRAPGTPSQAGGGRSPGGTASRSWRRGSPRH